jgi:hypothetical protein
MVVLFALMPNRCHRHSVIVLNFKKRDRSRVSEGNQQFSPARVLLQYGCAAPWSHWRHDELVVLRRVAPIYRAQARLAEQRVADADGIQPLMRGGQRGVPAVADRF